MTRQRLERLVLWLLGKLVLLGAGVVILAALLTGAARLLLPKVPGYKTDIETVVSKAVGHPLRIGSITVGWGGLAPYIRLNEVRLLKSPHGPVLLSLKQISASLDPLASLRDLRPVPGRIVVQGLAVEFVREADGHVTLSGLPLVAKAGEGGGRGAAEALYWLNGAHFLLSDTTITFIDKAHGIRYRLGPLTLGARIGAGGALRVAGQTPLPFGPHSQFRFAARLQGLASDGGRHWSGRIWTRLDQAPLGLPLLHVFIPQWPGVHGLLSTQTWSDWQDGRPARVIGHFDLRHFALTGYRAGDAATRPGAAITHMSGDFRFLTRADGWELDAADIVAGNARMSWPTTAFSVAERDQGTRRIYGWAQYLNLQGLLPLLTALPVVPETVRSRIVAAAPRGILSDARFDLRLPPRGLPQVTASAVFSGLGMRPDGALPGIQGLSGSVSITPAGGAAVIDSPGFAFDAPRYFQAPPPPATLRADITWAQSADGLRFQAPSISYENADLGVTGRFGMWLPLKGGAPDLDLEVNVTHGRVAAVPQYMPTRLLGKDLVHWLRTSLIAGRITRARVILKGDPHRFPFRNGGGLFEAQADVSGGAIAYLKRWPPLGDVSAHLQFKDAALEGAASSGQILATRIQSATVSIPDIMHPVIDIHGRALGPLADVPRFLSFTPVAAGHEALFASMRASGQEHAKIHLQLPLHHGRLGRMRLEGSTRIIDGGFSLPAQGVALNKIDGVFHFTLHSLSAQDVKAVFRGQPVRLQAATDAAHVARITLSGRFPAGILLPGRTPLASLIHGTAQVNAGLALPMTDAGMARQGIDLAITSNLRGLAIDLPSPLGKTAAAARPLALNLSLSRPDGPIELRYGSALRALLRLGGTGDCHYLAAADIRYAAGAPRLGRGISIEAVLPGLDVDAWRKLGARLSGLAQPAAPAAVSSACPSGPAALLDRLRRVSLRTDRLTAFGKALGAFSLQAARTASAWQAQIDSPLAQGSLQVPLPLHAGLPIRFDFKRMDIDSGWLSGFGSAGGKPPPAFDPASIPPLSGHIGQFRIAGRTLENIDLTTAPVAHGLKLHALQISQPHLQAKVSGQWLRIRGTARTELQAVLKTDDAGAALSAFKIDDALAGGSGEASATLAWKGAPYAFNWRSLNGKADLSLANGRITKVRIGILGHLLGLFNLNSLPAHLSQGLGSAFKEGFAYSKLTANAVFGQGNIYIKQATLAGSVARIQAQGKIDMLTHRLDIDVTAIPQISSAVTIAGAVAGGPAVGAVIYLLDRVLGMGKHINHLVAVRYHVGGAWNDPKITPAGGLAGNGTSAQPHRQSTPLY